jgi:hypothetical protein
MTTLTRIDPAQTVSSTFDRDHGLVDRLGRKVGARVYLDKVVFELSPEGSTWGYHKPVGTYYRVVTQPLRNGSAYQASQDAKYFDTLEEAGAYAEAYFAKNLKANAKKFPLAA